MTLSTKDLKLSSHEFDLLRELIEKQCGIAMGRDKEYLIESRLAQLVLEYGCATYGEFYQKAKEGRDPTLQRKILDAVTTRETFWFRDDHPYTILKEVLLPKLFEEMVQGKRSEIRIWSAACSTGQEPYSITMMAHDVANNPRFGPHLMDRFHVMATDISPSAIVMCKLGRYDSISMSRGMTPQFRERYFDEQGKVSVLKDVIKKHVTFQQFNLQEPILQFGKFDIVFLRNVAIYFSLEFKKQLLSRIEHVLHPNGILIMGTSESLIGIPSNFTLQTHGRGIYYQLSSPGSPL